MPPFQTSPFNRKVCPFLRLLRGRINVWGVFTSLHAPRFHDGSFSQAVTRARQDLKLLVVYLHSFLANHGTEPQVWSNYSNLTRPHPKWWFSKGHPLISGKSRLVKYYNLARNNGTEPQVSLFFRFLLRKWCDSGWGGGVEVQKPMGYVKCCSVSSRNVYRNEGSE